LPPNNRNRSAVDCATAFVIANLSRDAWRLRC
jgi:hypothetical protein